jgi:formate/nitrite transporter FocA (FNT family)
LVCPNCAIVIDDEWHGPKGRTDITKNPAGPLEASLRETHRMMETLNTRVKYIVSSVVAAVIVAAFLRHTAHTYAGFSREEIRAGALTMCSVFSLALVLWRGSPYP